MRMIVYGAKKVTAMLLRERVIEKEYEEVYQYGMELLISTAWNLLLVIILGALFHQAGAGVLYFLILATVRTQAGGYHASTYFRCGCVYCITFLMVLGFIRLFAYMEVSFAYLMTGLVINNTWIWLQAPVLHNRRMEDGEKKLAKRNAGFACALWTGIAALLYIRSGTAAYAVLASEMMISAYMVIGKMKEDQSL